MKYPQIIALVPDGEHFDESAINEGVWLSMNHLTKIEASLLTNSVLLNSTETVNGMLTEARETITGLQAAATENATTISTQAARIAELEAENATLGKQPSGKGTKLKVAAEQEHEEEVPDYLSDDAPENEWLDKRMGKRK